MNGKPKLWQNLSKPENLIVIFSFMRSSVWEKREPKKIGFAHFAQVYTQWVGTAKMVPNGLVHP